MIHCTGKENVVGIYRNIANPSLQIYLSNIVNFLGQWSSPGWM